MPTYFTPLRRKIGVVALGLACASLVWWLRASIIRAATPLEQIVEYGMEAGIAMILCGLLTALSADLLLYRPRPPNWPEHQD